MWIRDAREEKKVAKGGEKGCVRNINYASHGKKKRKSRVSILVSFILLY